MVCRRLIDPELDVVALPALSALFKRFIRCLQCKLLYHLDLPAAMTALQPFHCTQHLGISSRTSPPRSKGLSSGEPQEQFHRLGWRRWKFITNKKASKIVYIWLHSQLELSELEAV